MVYFTRVAIINCIVSM